MTKIDLFQAFEKAFPGGLISPEDLENKEAKAAKVIALDTGHKAAKEKLSGRVQVLRVLVNRANKHKQGNMTNWEYSKRCERQLDNLLKKHDYRVEFLIDKYREHVTIPEPEIIWCEKCGYLPHFCCCERGTFL